MKGNYNADREAATYCAVECSRIGRRESTWYYRDGDGQEFAVTAKLDDENFVRTTTRPED